MSSGALCVPAPGPLFFLQRRPSVLGSPGAPCLAPALPSRPSFLLVRPITGAGSSEAPLLQAPRLLPLLAARSRPSVCAPLLAQSLLPLLAARVRPSGCAQSSPRSCPSQTVIHREVSLLLDLAHWCLMELASIPCLPSGDCTGAL